MRLAGALAVLLLASVAGLARPARTDARVATSGGGRFLDMIDWFEWGTSFETISGLGTQTRTRVTTVGGVDLAVTCSLSDFKGVALAYLPASWPGDALDELYAIGGPGAANTLVSGVSVVGDETRTETTFAFACSATLGGRPVPLEGIVVADAEQSIKPERVQATIASGATWRIIDRLRSPGCEASTLATRTDDGVANTLVLAGTSLCETGPAVVAFADGASSGTAGASSPAFGRSAIALGVPVAIDRGDAPSSYGEAGHLRALSFGGGAMPSDGSVHASAGEFALAGPSAPPTRLGESVDPGGAPSDDARGDDDAGTGGVFGAADDETADPLATIEVAAGASLTRRDIACTGPGAVAGWIDFDASGSFEATERSRTADCTGATVDLVWSEVPATVRAQARAFERLRIAADVGDIASPTGLAATGEVEDHALALTLAPAPPPGPVPPPPDPPPPPALNTALNSATTGSAFAAAPAPPEPQQGESVAIAESAGTVRVKVPGATRYVDVARLTEVPLGSRIDARAGEVTITTEVDARTGATQTGTFFAGIFVVSQTGGRKPLLVLTLAGGSFSGCSGRQVAARTALGAASDPIPFRFAAKRKRSKRKVRRLWGKGKGDFRTSGLRSSATVRGTTWLVEDRCDGTYTRVRQGTVDVRDFRLRKTIRLTAGKRSLYLANAP